MPAPTPPATLAGGGRAIAAGGGGGGKGNRGAGGGEGRVIMNSNTTVKKKKNNNASPSVALSTAPLLPAPAPTSFMQLHTAAATAATSIVASAIAAATATVFTLPNAGKKMLSAAAVTKTNTAAQFIAWARWGRVGEHGQSSFLYGPGPDKAAAVSAYKSKVSAKSKKYTILKRDYGPPVAAGGAAAGSKKKKGKAAVKAVPKSKLNKKVQDFVKLISDIKMMENMIKPQQSVLQDLSSQFYTVVPHSFGRALPPTINTKLMVKLDMCSALADIQVAQKILKQVEVSENPIDACYASLKVDMIEDAFVIEREGEDARFKPFEADANRQLLWHGSRLSNYVGILSQGLRIAPPEAPVTGYMFDKGVYFADCVSKSANYCFTNKHAPAGVMLLCEVALGDQHEMKQANYHANTARQQAGKQSVKGLGRQAPDDAGAQVVPNGVKVPCGKIIKDDSDGRALAYNEYIVYDTAQIKMRYVLKMKFGHKY
eukprot:gene21189-35648_t